jgi:hypothetical protein
VELSYPISWLSDSIQGSNECAVIYWGDGVHHASLQG